MITELSIGEVLLYSLAGIVTVIVVLAILACLITIVSRLVAKFAAKPVNCFGRAGVELVSGEMEFARG